MTASPILHIKDLTKRFGGLIAVDNVSFDVPEGGIIGLIGPKAKGRQTIFNLITGIYKPTSGSIEFKNNSLLGLESHFRIAEKGITRTFQNIRLFKNLSVFDNVLTACHRNANYNFAEAIFRLPRFRTQERAHGKNGAALRYHGAPMLQRSHCKQFALWPTAKAGNCGALALNPILLLLDEPAANL